MLHAGAAEKLFEKYILEVPTDLGIFLCLLIFDSIPHLDINNDQSLSIILHLKK